MHQAPSPPTFGTLLIRRKANERPSDLELRLRPLSQKIRIVEKLAGNAHLMVPGSPSLAIRVYTVDEINKLEESVDGSNNVDGLQHFRDSFEHSMVFFVLPRGEDQNNQLGRRESFVNAAQQALLFKSGGGGETKNRRSTRTLIVSDTAQVINAVSSVVQSLAPEKREKKKQYFAQIANQNYLPNKETGKDPTQEAIANHVSKTFHAWAERMGMPEGDSNVLLSIMGSLGGVVTADEKALDDLPIRNATKDIVSMFFGSPKAKHPPNNKHVDTENTFDTGSISEAFDDIDDEELLQIPNPSVIPNAQQKNVWPRENTNPNVGNFQEYNQSQPNFNSYNSNSSNGYDRAARYTNDIGFTPIQPPTNHYDPRAYSTIIPDLFVQQNNFHSSMQHVQYPSHSVRRTPYQSDQGSRRGSSYQGDYGYDHTSGYRQFR